MKAAASTIAGPAANRHLEDCAVLLSIAGRKDLALDTITPKERRRLVRLAHDLHEFAGLAAIEGAPDGLNRLTRTLDPEHP